MYDVSNMYEASSAEQALHLLQTHQDAILVAGGTDVMIRKKERKLKNATLISILNIAALKQIHLDDEGALVIGAGCCFTDICHNELILQLVPMLAEACNQVGSPQIRNVATIGEIGRAHV